MSGSPPPRPSRRQNVQIYVKVVRQNKDALAHVQKTLSQEMSREKTVELTRLLEGVVQFPEEKGNPISLGVTLQTCGTRCI